MSSNNRRSVIFRGGETSSLREEHVERTRYRDSFQEEGFLDTAYRDYLYGLVNENYEPVVLPDASEFLVSFGDLADDVFVLNFVRDRFLRMREDYQILIQNSSLVTFPVNLSELTPKFGHVSFDDKFEQYSTGLIQILAGIFDNERVTSFQSFLSEFESWILSSDSEPYPITRSGFLLSTRCDVATTGIYINMNPDLDVNEDRKKGETIQDPSFSCYLDFCKYHGFYVDKNVPWRLVANLESPKMKESIVTTTRDSSRSREVLNNFYRVKTHYDDLFSFQDLLFRVYSRLLEVNRLARQSIEYDSATNSSSQTSVFRTDTGNITREHILRLLLKIRLQELASYDSMTFESKSNEVIEISRIYNVRQALGKIGKICSDIIREIYAPIHSVD